MNANIMKTQIFHKIKYDLKSHFYVMGSFRNCIFFKPSSIYNLNLSSYEHLLSLFLFSMNDINLECRSLACIKEILHYIEEH